MAWGFLFLICFNYLRDAVIYSHYFIFAYNIIKSPRYCSLLQSVRGLWAANNTKLRAIKQRQTNRLIYVYKFCQSSTKNTDCVRDLIFQDLNFISIIMLTIYSYILSVWSCLDLVLSITFFFPSLECLYTLYYILIETKLKYVTLVWNSIMSTDADKLEST